MELNYKVRKRAPKLRKNPDGRVFAPHRWSLSLNGRSFGNPETLENVLMDSTRREQMGNARKKKKKSEVVTNIHFLWECSPRGTGGGFSV